MTGQHDYWSHLNPMEKARMRTEERQIDAKTDYLKGLPRRGYEKTKERINLEIAGHKFFKNELINRGVQRARLGIKPRKRKAA